MRRLAIGEISARTALPRAKPRREARLLIGMRVLAVVGCLFALWASPGCFELNYPSCRIRCNIGEGCPRDLHCVASDTTDYFCAAAGVSTCASSTGNDAGGPDKEGGASGPPQEICHRGSCLTLPDAIRSNLVLLLWPSNLPTAGSAVSVWSDLSGKGNDAKALNSGALPAVVADGVKLVPDQPGAGFEIENGPSLDFAAEDFVVIVVSGLKTTTPATFFLKSDLNRDDPRQIALAWAASPDPAIRRPQGRVNRTIVDAGVDLAQPSVNVYALRRTGNHVELRVNGVVLGSGDLASAAESTTNAEAIFLGVSSPSSPAVDSLQGAFAIRGTINSEDLSGLETFLRLTLTGAR